MSNKKLGKSLELLLFLFENSKDIQDMTEMKVYKLMYFLEKTYFENFWKPFVGKVINRNHHWPIFTKLKKEKYFDDYIKATKSQDWKITYYNLNSDIDFKLSFTKKEKNVLSEWLEKYKYLSSSKLRNISHDEAPFLMAKFWEIIDIENTIYNKVLEDEKDDNKDTIDLNLNQLEINTFLSHLKNKYGK